MWGNCWQVILIQICQWLGRLGRGLLVLTNKVLRRLGNGFLTQLIIGLSDKMNGRTYKCPSHGCSHVYSSKYNVRRHLKVAHPFHNHFTCVQCGKVLSSKQNYKQHLHIHSGAKPFLCPFPSCGKAFRQGSQLSIHKRSHWRPEVFSIPKVRHSELTEMIDFQEVVEEQSLHANQYLETLPAILPQSDSPVHVVLRKFTF